MIDGVDIVTVGVHTLRQNLAIIPQDAAFEESILAVASSACFHKSAS